MLLTNFPFQPGLFHTKSFFKVILRIKLALCRIYFEKQKIPPHSSPVPKMLCYSQLYMPKQHCKLCAPKIGCLRRGITIMECPLLSLLNVWICFSLDTLLGMGESRTFTRQATATFSTSQLRQKHKNVHKMRDHRFT